ncbi:MAG: (Fe-S)-binding protein [Calditrichia bacterium]
MDTKPLHKIEIPSDDILTQCMHCGLCLPVCPTYSLTRLERSSPRGRIRLIKEVTAGHLPITENFRDEMYFCLDCQACATVCPAGVAYGQLVEAARAQILLSGTEKFAWLKKFFFRRIFPYNQRLKLAARLLRFYQRYLQNIVQKSGVLRLISKKLDRAQGMSPLISSQFSDAFIPERLVPGNHPRYRVGMLTGCLMNVMFADINRDTVEVLLENDCEIITPKQQVCCGSLAGHNGDFEIARHLARKNIDVFLSLDLDAIVINSAGCSAFMKEYGELLHEDEEYREKAEQLSRIVKDISEFLVEINFKKPAVPLKGKITYHDACHLAHSQKITREPREVLQGIPGLEIIELAESTWCCGSAGIYNVIRQEPSMQILDRKIKNILATGAEILVTGNPGCMGQIAYGLKGINSAIEVIHPVTLLNRAYKQKG